MLETPSPRRAPQSNENKKQTSAGRMFPQTNRFETHFAPPLRRYPSHTPTKLYSSGNLTFRCSCPGFPCASHALPVPTAGRADDPRDPARIHRQPQRHTVSAKGSPPFRPRLRADPVAEPERRSFHAPRPALLHAAARRRLQPVRNVVIVAVKRPRILVVAAPVAIVITSGP